MMPIIFPSPRAHNPEEQHEQKEGYAGKHDADYGCSGEVVVAAVVIVVMWTVLTGKRWECIVSGEILIEAGEGVEEPPNNN
jgi:hypothetical protein